MHTATATPRTRAALEQARLERARMFRTLITAPFRWRPRLAPLAAPGLTEPCR